MNDDEIMRPNQNLPLEMVMITHGEGGIPLWRLCHAPIIRPLFSERLLTQPFHELVKQITPYFKIVTQLPWFKWQFSKLRAVSLETKWRHTRKSWSSNVVTLSTEWRSAYSWENAFQYGIKPNLVVTSSKRHNSFPIGKCVPTNTNSSMVVYRHSMRLIAHPYKMTSFVQNDEKYITVSFPLWGDVQPQTHCRRVDAVYV